jgi:DNA modification methylase
VTPSWRIIVGDAAQTVSTLPAASVQCCVTSPPYYSLRDYGVDGQIGLEDTPDEYVQRLVDVFREVRRVLRDDGTVWINLGDSYASSPRGNTNGWEGSGLHGAGSERYQATLNGGTATKRDTSRLPGTKPKDLLGVPWAVAQALRAPYYAGRINAERDRVWLAAIMDGEGSISGFTHVRADDGSTRTGVHVCITNTSEALLGEAHRIWPASCSEHARNERLGTRDVWRWIAHGAERKALLMRELYPYLIAKRPQAQLAYRFLMLSVDAKRLGHSPQRDATRQRRAWLVDALSRLNHGEAIDVPSWVGEPPSLHEPGWYLRQEIIWAKTAPMPESVRDRCTRAHEQVFMLSKRPTYFYDQEAIKQPSSDPGRENGRDGRDEDERARPPGSRPRTLARRDYREHGANRRSVWTLGPEPFADAHFAVMPGKLARDCVLAGSPEMCCGTCGAPWERVADRHAAGEGHESPKDRSAFMHRKPGRTMDSGFSSSTLHTQYHDIRRITVGWRASCEHDDPSGSSVVLDPFSGAGTTGVQALRAGRSYVGVELNPEYAELARNRIRDDAPLMNVPAEEAA